MLHSHLVNDRCRDEPDTVPACISDEEQSNDGVNGNADTPHDDQSDGGICDVDDIVLGAPAADPGVTNNEICNPVTNVTIAKAANSCPTEALYPWVEAGCMLDRDNWSCSYDSVFMSFFFIYKKSPSAWRSKWSQQVPTWNGPLEAAFDKLIAMAHNRQHSQATLSQEFTSFREGFRDQLSLVNPVYFKRYGQVSASVCNILSYLLGGVVTQEPHLNQQLVCNRCGTSAPARCSFPLLGSTELLRTFRHQDDPEYLPLQIAVTRYVEHSSHNAHLHRCPGCPGSLSVGSLTIPDMAWLWIELCDSKSPVSPSLRLVFHVQAQRQVYNLQAVIYNGGNHFTARFFDHSSTWWNYDDMRRFGAPFAERVEDELDLLDNGDRRASFLLYSREDCSG